MDSRITAIAGPARAIYITHLIARLERDAARGAQWARLADRLIAQDIGLSTPQVRRARRWWCTIGVVQCVARGIPPTEEYAIQPTLEAWRAWLANAIVTPASQHSDASVTTSRRQRHNVVTPASPLDHDHDDDDDDRPSPIKKEISKAENAARALGLDPSRIRRECDEYSPKYPDRYYLQALRQRIAQAQAPLPTPAPGPGSGSRPARPGSGSGSRTARTDYPTHGTFRRRQVTYTEDERRAAEERARQRLEAKRSFRRPQVHYTDEQRRAVEERHRAELEAEGYYLKGVTNEHLELQ